MDVIAGIDIGGTKIGALLIDEQGRVVGRGVVAAPAADGGAAMADTAAALVQRLAADSGIRVLAAGVGAAGVIDSDAGVVRAASATFADWAGFALGAELGARLGVPVRIENDVNAFLQGEASHSGAGGDVLGIMLGTGVGGALMLGGRLHHGAHGAAGEIGHTPGYSQHLCTCGQVGHLETMASGASIVLRFAERTGRTLADAGAVAELAHSGDTDALAVFHDAGRAVALAGVIAAGILDLGTVIVGGGVTKSWELLEPAIAATLATDSPVSGVPIEFRRAQLGPTAVAVGAAESARVHLLHAPALRSVG